MLAQSDPEKYRDLSESIIGIAFMATPHNGSDSAERLRRVARILPRHRSELIRPLVRNSNELCDISIAFSKIIQQFPMASFIEEKNHPFLREKIVHKTSAVMAVANEHIIPLPGTDHRTVCRFASECDNYQKVQKVLQEFIDKYHHRECQRVVYVYNL